MYELTCPTCGQKTALPFVRVGAAAQCRSCGARYQVQASQVQRRVTVPAVESEGGGPLVLGPPIVRSVPGRATAPPRAAATGSSNAPTSAGLAATATASPPTPPPPTMTTPPPPTRTPPPATAAQPPELPLPPALPPPSISAVAQMIAKRKRQRRRAAVVRYLGVITLVLLIVVGVGWLLQSMRHPPAAHAPGSGKPQPGAAPSAGLGNHVLEPMISSRRVETPAWVSIDRAAQYNGQDTDPLRLEDQSLLNRGPQVVMYSARVVCSSFDIIEEAVLYLELVDMEGRAFAQTTVPLLLLNGSQSAMVRLPIPRASYDRLQTVGWKIDVQRKMAGGVNFDKVMAEPVGNGERAALRLTAFNPLPSDLKRAVFVIAAMDVREELLGRWRVEWSQPIGPRQRVELTAATPLPPGMSATHWQVVAAGEPAAVPAPTPEPEPQP